MVGVTDKVTGFPTHTVEGVAAAEISGLVFRETDTFPFMVALQTGVVLDVTSTI